MKTAKERAQAKRFVDAAREAGCGEDEAEIRESILRVAKSAKPTKSAPPKS
jgi:hypothetical protein